MQLTLDWSHICLTYFTATITPFPHTERKSTAISRLLWRYFFRGCSRSCVNTAVARAQWLVTTEPLMNKIFHICTMSGFYQNLPINFVNFWFLYRKPRSLISSYFMSTTIKGVDLGGVGWVVSDLLLVKQKWKRSSIFWQKLKQTSWHLPHCIFLFVTLLVFLV